MLTEQPPAVPSPFKRDFQSFERALRQQGLRAGLHFLNRRTSHRYTGVFRFDADMLRSVALVDSWDPSIELGDDVPLAAAYCAHLYRTGEPLEVEDGSHDDRVGGMARSPVVSYCGAVIRDADGRPWGALCHFDPARCDSKESDMPLLIAAAAIIFDEAAGAV